MIDLERALLTFTLATRGAEQAPAVQVMSQQPIINNYQLPSIQIHFSKNLFLNRSHLITLGRFLLKIPQHRGENFGEYLFFY